MTEKDDAPAFVRAMWDAVPEEKKEELRASEKERENDGKEDENV